jgi:hypothetical protein
VDGSLMGRGTRKRALKRHRAERTARVRAAADAMRESVADRTAALQRRRDAGELTDEEVEVEVEELAEDLRQAEEADRAADAA